MERDTRRSGPSRPLPGLRDAYDQVAHPEERGHPRREAVHHDDRGWVAKRNAWESAALQAARWSTRGRGGTCSAWASSWACRAARSRSRWLRGSRGASLAREPHCQRGRSDPAAALSLLLPSSPHSSLTRGSISLFCLASISSGETGLQVSHQVSQPVENGPPNARLGDVGSGLSRLTAVCGCRLPMGPVAAARCVSAAARVRPRGAQPQEARQGEVRCGTASYASHYDRPMLWWPVEVACDGAVRGKLLELDGLVLRGRRRGQVHRQNLGRGRKGSALGVG